MNKSSAAEQQPRASAQYDLEADLQREAGRVLRIRGVRYARNNSGRKNHVRFGLVLPVSPEIKSGGPDFIVFPRGLPVEYARSLEDVEAALRAHPDEAFGLEFKAKRGRETGDLDRWIEWMKRRVT